VLEWQKRDAMRNAFIVQPPAQRDAQRGASNIERLADIGRRIADLDRTLAADFPNYAGLAEPEPLSVSEVQDQLRPNEALVLFLAAPQWKPAEEATFVWVVTKTASRWVKTRLGSTALRDRVDALRCGLDYEGSWTGSRCFDLLNTAFTEDDRRNGKPLPFSLHRAHSLYRELFGRLENMIAGKDLLVVPSGPLTQLPFHVLVTKKPSRSDLTADNFRNAAWLVKQHSITVLPSVASLAALRRHAKVSKAHKPLVGFGNPLLDGNPVDAWQKAAARRARAIMGCAGRGGLAVGHLRQTAGSIKPLGRGLQPVDPAEIRFQAPLPETADELCEVARSVGATTRDIYLGARATETRIKSLSATGTLATYKVLHFATHAAIAGELRSSNEPGLILSPPERASSSDDGYLSASDVASLRLDAEWVILSACNTAGGRTRNAEALSGLARAFFYAGARSLLVSHWYVNSQATVELITSAIAVLQGDRRIGQAGAMRKAMLGMMGPGKSTWHPADWAPFIVVGEGAYHR
ncbi:MAG: CHAT domain-containing protein, partial [Hyphomicrobiaceae bacterium]